MGHMQRLMRHIHSALTKNRKTLAAAESCTGGLLSTLLTRSPGSSRYFLLGIVAYSNAAKRSLLGVPAQLIASRGAVSAEVARSMSEQVRRRAHADYGIGVTGIAGPSGGSARKPVGTVYIAISDSRATACKRFLFYGSRHAVRRHAAFAALTLLKERL